MEVEVIQIIITIIIYVDFTNTKKYHVFCTDGKISVRINLSSSWDDGGK